jgi:predicted MFS family arabinose efflux permease
VRVRTQRQPGEGISRGLVILLAIATGASVANLYYAQPLLHAIAAGLHSSPSTAALLVTASQIGYAAGLLLIVPLGDLVDRRLLVVRMLGVCALALVIGALAPGLGVLALAIALAGVTSTVAQVLVPFASVLASEDQRGRVVGEVMSGLLTGILVARTFSGLIAQAAGWRAVFGFGAFAMVALALALWRSLPDVPPSERASYPRLLASVGTLLRDEPLLRMRMIYGGMGMASFSVLWTTLALLLSRAPFHYGSAVIGLFGLAGMAGAIAAQAAGRAADGGRASRATGLFLAAIAAGWALLAAGQRSVAVLVIGIAVLDLGIQGQHILNQTVIYARRPDARSRLTTAYMTGNFLCGAIASALAAAVWDSGGWGAVCALGGACSGLALVVWAAGRFGALPDVRPGVDAREPARAPDDAPAAGVREHAPS